MVVGYWEMKDSLIAQGMTPVAAGAEALKRLRLTDPDGVDAYRAKAVRSEKKDKPQREKGPGRPRGKG
jgi:hypothetical protein